MHTAAFETKFFFLDAVLRQTANALVCKKHKTINLKYTRSSFT